MADSKEMFTFAESTINHMLKLLIKLWADQKRRNFKWGRFFGQTYFFVLIMIISVIFTFATYEDVGDESAEIVVPFLAACIIIPDFLHKLLMKHDETVMDHYLKSKPIPERSWNRFLLITNLVNFWNWFIPILFLPFYLVFLKWTVMFPSFLLLVAVSMVGGVAITAFRRAKGWTNKWPVLVAMAIWALFAFMYSLLAFLLPWGLHMVGFFLLCLGAVAVFYSYLCELHRYDESQSKAGKLFLTGASSLFSMEYIGVLRSKRLRMATLILPVVFVFNTYSLVSQEEDFMLYMMLMFAIFTPSMMLGQWVFGIEGNYFDGLWTKPVNIRTILKNKFRFFSLLNIFPTLLILPLIWMADLSPWLLVVTWLFTAGLANLTLMPTALISSRIELFQSAFFNYQGASLAVYIYGMIAIIPLAVYVVCLSLLPLTTAMIVLAAAGIVGFSLHQAVINIIASKYEKNRYKNFERYRS